MKIPLTTLLLVLFISLKLTGYITWSWVWVLSPLWITAIVYVIALFTGLALIYMVGGKITVKDKQKK
jgi:hypothetical protein